MVPPPSYLFFFFFNDTATTEIYTLSLHDALPICSARSGSRRTCRAGAPTGWHWPWRSEEHSLNSSHLVISYAVFCLKKKKKKTSNKRSEDRTDKHDQERTSHSVCRTRADSTRIVH